MNITMDDLSGFLKKHDQLHKTTGFRVKPKQRRYERRRSKLTMQQFDWDACSEE